MLIGQAWSAAQLYPFLDSLDGFPLDAIVAMVGQGLAWIPTDMPPSMAMKAFPWFLWDASAALKGVLLHESRRWCKTSCRFRYFSHRRT